MSQDSASRKRDGAKEDNVIPDDANRKKGRLWVFNAHIFVTPTEYLNSPMPLDVDDGLPGIELWFGQNESSEVGLLCHLDSCAATNTGDLTVHQWLMTAHPHIVAEYIQFDDETPFQPMQLQCAVNTSDAAAPMYGKLTAIVRYWLRYKHDDSPVILSFGLGADVAVNSIIVLPTLRQWRSGLDFENNYFVAPRLNTRFPLIYEPTKQGLPKTVDFSASNFVRPSRGMCDQAACLFTNVDVKSQSVPHASLFSSKIVDSNEGGCFKREVVTNPLL